MSSMQSAVYEPSNLVPGEIPRFAMGCKRVCDSPSPTPPKRLFDHSTAIRRGFLHLEMLPNNVFHLGQGLFVTVRAHIGEAFVYVTQYDFDGSWYSPTRQGVILRPNIFFRMLCDEVKLQNLDYEFPIITRHYEGDISVKSSTERIKISRKKFIDDFESNKKWVEISLSQWKMLLGEKDKISSCIVDAEFGGISFVTLYREMEDSMFLSELEEVGYDSDLDCEIRTIFHKTFFNYMKTTVYSKFPSCEEDDGVGKIPRTLFNREVMNFNVRELIRTFLNILNTSLVFLSESPLRSYVPTSFLIDVDILEKINFERYVMCENPPRCLDILAESLLHLNSPSGEDF